MVSNSCHRRWQTTTCSRTLGLGHPNVETMNWGSGEGRVLLCSLPQGLPAYFGGNEVILCPEKTAQARTWHAGLLFYALPHFFSASYLEKIFFVCLFVPTHPALRVKRLTKPCTIVIQAKCSMFLECYTILRALYVVFYTVGFLLEGKADLMSDSCLG